jgi:hypothetical protein
MKRSLLIYALCVGVLALIAGVKVSAHAQDSDRYKQSEWNDSDWNRILRGYKVSPVPLDLHGKNYELVGLGSYLVNSIGGCNDCHTQPSYVVGGNPFLGQPKKVNVDHYLGGGQAFGPFISRNLTPEHGLPAGHTYAEFVQIMRKGTDFDHPGQLLQVMPWPTYQTLTDRDLRAIYEYLRAIPPATPGT